MNIEVTQNGLLITDIKNNQQVKQMYQGYSKRDAIRKFKKFYKEFK